MGPRPCGRGKMGGGDSEETESLLQGGLTVHRRGGGRQLSGGVSGDRSGRAHTIHFIGRHLTGDSKIYLFFNESVSTTFD